MSDDLRKPRFYPWPGGLYMMGRFSVPWWVFNVSPRWLHHAADWCGGVEPSPWPDLRARIRRAMFPAAAVGTPERVSVVDLKPGTRVKLFGQVYEVERIVRTFANERDVTLRQIGGPNLLELAELEYPFASFELAPEGDAS